MWIAIGVGAPVLVIAIFIALWPVLGGSARYHNWEHRRAGARGGALRASRVRERCPLCAASFEGTRNEVVAERNEHVVERHSHAGPGIASTPLTATTRPA